jgi:hypothetical protein
MERVWVAGNAGSGKTTLANLISKELDIPVYHRDYITWHEDSSMRPEDEQLALTKSITETSKWVFDGARFTASKIDGRPKRCDTIINLELNRLLCVCRVFKRAREKVKRTDLSAVDKQPFSFNILKYILWEYPVKRKQREIIFNLARKRGINVVVLKTKNDVSNFILSLSKS